MPVVNINQIWNIQSHGIVFSVSLSLSPSYLKAFTLKARSSSLSEKAALLSEIMKYQSLKVKSP